MTPSTLRRVSLAMVAIVAVGCSSNATADPTTTTIDRSPVTSPSTTTTAAPSTTTTTEPATTTTTIAETTVAPTEVTEPPTTLFQTSPTIYPTDDPRAEIETAYRTIEDHWLGCLALLPACDSSQLERYYGGRVLEVNKEQIDKLSVANYSVKGLEAFRYFVSDATIAGDTGTVQTCIFDPVTISRPNPAGGPDQIYAEGTSSTIFTATLERGADGNWRMVSAIQVNTVSGGKSLCADS